MSDDPVGARLRLGWGPLCRAGMVFVDTNHHGDVEDAVMQWLASPRCNFTGWLLLDDVHVNLEMEWVWGGGGRSRRGVRYDLSAFGHELTGTGLIDFSAG